MNANQEALMKHFASVLRQRALGNQKAPSISNSVSKYFSRKDLIVIIKNRFNGAIPKEYNLVETENEELLELIGDEMFIISYMTKKWSQAISFEKPKRNENPATEKKPTPSNAKKRQQNDTSSK